VARTITPKLSPTGNTGGGGDFFVPADAPSGAPPAQPQKVEEDDDDDDDDDDDGPQTLLQILNENLTLAFLARSRSQSADRECDRLIVGYLSLLSQWLWEDPSAVREFLNAGGLGSVCR
jgi:intracellular protein transport protein USO1